MTKKPEIPPIRGAQYRDCNNCIGSPRRGRVYDSSAHLWKKCRACDGTGRIILKNI